MSKIVADCADVSRSPLNFSMTKQLYSFPKSIRFSGEKTTYCDNFYRKPSTLSARATGMGYGNRFSEKVNTNPAPCSYEKPSEFRENNQKMAYTFGQGREKFQKVFLKHNPPIDITVPGPGAYKYRENVGREGARYTMRIRAPSESRKLSVPGPGAYQTVDGITKDGRHFFSRFRDSGSTALRSRAYRWGFENKTKKIVPGPGRYESPNTMTRDGKVFISKYQTSHSRHFGHAIRSSITDSLPFTPGPGSYVLSNNENC